MSWPGMRVGAWRTVGAGAILVVVASGCTSDNKEGSAVATTAALSNDTAAASTTTSTTSPATSTSVVPSSTSTSSTSTSSPTTSTLTSAPPSTAAGPLEFVDGRFAGIAQGSLLNDAAKALDLTPVRLFDIEPPPEAPACTGTEDPWAIVSGGLTLVFEDWEGSADTAFLTNWSYFGGPFAGFSELVAPHGITVGSSRDDVANAYPEAVGLDEDQIFVNDPSNVRFSMIDRTVEWFGIVDCVFEGVPED